MDLIQELGHNLLESIDGLDVDQCRAYAKYRERTGLMLGTKKDRSKGLVQKSIANVFAGGQVPGARAGDGVWSYERYHDACWGGPDYPAMYEAGKAYNHVIVEVENGEISPSSGDYGQVKKVLNWLMNTQANYKWAVLYYRLGGGTTHDNIADYTEAIKAALADVVAKFIEAKLMEAETSYLITLGPSELHPDDHAKGWFNLHFLHVNGCLKWS